jgi:CheY-like chemotaxis protein
MNDSDSRELGKSYKKGEVIYKQGDRANCCYIVQQGRVAITRRTSKGEKHLLEAGKGEFFGEVSLFTADKNRFSTAHALEKSRVLKIDEKFLITRLHTDPSLSFRIIRHLAQRVYDLDYEVSESQVGVDDKGKKKKKRTEKVAGKASGFMESKHTGQLRNVHDFSVGHHFLVVEDEPDFFKVINSWLSAIAPDDNSMLLPSFKVTHVTTVKEAEKRLGRDKYDLILLDLHLPDSRGYETFARMNAEAFDTPIVVLTSLDDEKLAIQAMDDGAQDYLIKGQINRKSLVRAIRYALARHHMKTTSHSDELLDTWEPEEYGYIGKFRGWLNSCIEMGESN